MKNRVAYFVTGEANFNFVSVEDVLTTSKLMKKVAQRSRNCGIVYLILREKHLIETVVNVPINVCLRNKDGLNLFYSSRSIK